MIGKWNLQMLQTRFELDQMSRPWIQHCIFPSLAVCRYPKSPLSGTYLPINNSWKYLMLVLRWTTGDLSNRQNQSWIFCCWHHLLFPFKDTPFHQMFSEKESHRLICLALVDLKRQIWTFQHLRGNLIWYWQLLWIYSDHYYDYEMTVTDIIVDVVFFLMPNPGSKI